LLGEAGNKHFANAVRLNVIAGKPMPIIGNFDQGIIAF
jgi:hypothetical protein